MNIKPIGMLSNTNFKANKDVVDSDGDYVDPMMNWPLRGAAFTNEVGEALRPVIGSYATLTWAPALMYIGADVYDKYKNDQTEYSPNSRRCLKQALFQGLASVILPVFAVKAGQNAFSQFGKLSEDKISINAKEHVANVAEHFIANGKMRAFDGKNEECRKEFLSQVVDSFDYNNKKKSFINALNIFRLDKKENIEKYSLKTIDNLIRLRENLIQPNEKFKTNGWYIKYLNAIKDGQTKNVAIKSVLTNYQKGKLLKGNLIKTIGGFVALGVAIKPIDNFVENVLIGKYVGPRIDNMKYHNK